MPTFPRALILIQRAKDNGRVNVVVVEKILCEIVLELFFSNLETHTILVVG